MSRSPDRFAATLGVRERWSSLAAVVLGVGGFTIVGIVLTAQRGELMWLVLSLPFTLLLLVMARLAPTGYRLDGDAIHVERRAREARIPYRTIRAVDREHRQISGITVGGSNGVFGRFGRFWNMRLGFYRLFLTNRDHVVWLQTDDGWVALSPDRPDEFVARVQSRLSAR